MRIRAVVFDFDGLICDTEGPDLASWQETFTEHGVELPLEWWLSIVGTAGHRHPIDILEEMVGGPFDAESVRTRRRTRYLEICAQTLPLPGVLAWLDEAARLGLGLGLASSSDERWIAGHLSRLGLSHRFDVVRTRDDVAVDRAKPWPDLYLSAVEALGVPPEEALAVEDSPNGTLAAKRAGLYCVAVPNPVTRTLDFAHADVVLTSLGDLPLTAVLARLDGSGAQRPFRP